ncbi:unnamed protein product [Acanthoscelides obtectus]|uniref:Uncharacterized protein n=1 Tax=Acanthoscelides obtectus TaxID=200917 RepID=A0A9P0PWM5_ACAOB|nr:unnamed protein product [Acanthoscelides obtectus]CAK1665571.1 hypothetical protein AOBTE_LOCUS24886 [Acanthoscelides obtectus]
MFYIYTWQAFIPYIKCWPRVFGSFFAFVPVFDKTRISIKKGFRIYCLFVTVVLSALLVYEFYKEVTSSTTYYRLRIITSTLQLISTSRVIIDNYKKMAQNLLCDILNNNVDSHTVSHVYHTDGESVIQVSSNGSLYSFNVNCANSCSLF